MSNDPQVNQERQPSLMFPVVGTDGRGADNPELIDHSAFSDDRAMVSGDVVDTNWDIPKIEFSEDWPSAQSDVPLPPAFPPEVTEYKRQVPEKDAVWDTRLDLEPVQDEEPQAIVPLFAEQNIGPREIRRQEDNVSRRRSAITFTQDSEFMDILSGAASGEVNLPHQRGLHMRGSYERAGGRRRTFYVACGVLMVIVVGVIVIAGMQL